MPSKYLTKPQKLKTYNDKKKFNCEYCDKSFSRVDNLNRHISKFCKKKIELDKLKKENDELIEKQNQIIKSQSKQLTKFEKLPNQKLRIKLTILRIMIILIIKQ